MNGNVTRFGYDPQGRLIYEQDPAGNTHVYVWVDGKLLARIDNGTTIYYIHTDALGTVHAMTDASGNVVWRARYTPFGQATIVKQTITNNLRQPGQYYDQETGLAYNLNRDYDASLGRYVEADPLGLAAGDNPYLYANENPLSYVDPLGLWQFSISGGLGLGGQVTFGKNGGQWNFGAHFGAGEGLSATLDPHDSGCHSPGFQGSLKGEGQIGFGPNVDATSEIGPNNSSADASLHVPGTPVNFAVSDNNGSLEAPGITFGFGESAFFGTGGTVYFGK